MNSHTYTYISFLYVHVKTRTNCLTALPSRVPIKNSWHSLPLPRVSRQPSWAIQFRRCYLYVHLYVHKHTFICLSETHLLPLHRRRCCLLLMYLSCSRVFIKLRLCLSVVRLPLPRLVTAFASIIVRLFVCLRVRVYYACIALSCARKSSLLRLCLFMQ